MMFMNLSNKLNADQGTANLLTSSCQAAFCDYLISTLAGVRNTTF